MSHPVSDAALLHLQAMVDWPAIADERYELRESLGRGGMGSVYLAHDRELDRLVAIKVLSTHLPSPAAMERLVREAKILARLEHPGIVPVHDTGTTEDGRPYYVMKLVKGTGLAGRVATGLPPGDGFRIFERICDAVALAHSLGVVHRDLKPGNIMVGSFGEVLVMDWGVAKLADARESPGTVLGTPGYMSPEQARGDVAATDHRTDIYALGVMLESLLPDPPAPALRAIARKAAAPEPADRYQSVPALAEDLSRFRAGLAVAAYPENLFRRLRRVAWKYRVPIALILAYVLMRVALLLVQG